LSVRYNQITALNEGNNELSGITGHEITPTVIEAPPLLECGSPGILHSAIPPKKTIKVPTICITVDVNVVRDEFSNIPAKRIALYSYFSRSITISGKEKPASTFT
jgi:hypothetical protein